MKLIKEVSALIYKNTLTGVEGNQDFTLTYMSPNSTAHARVTMTTMTDLLLW